jgi:amino-acid N-acetyltransferase
MTFRFTRPNDLPKIKQLLSDASLPSQDIDQHISHFIIAEKSGELIGVIGLELIGKVALLRSAAVVNSERGTGLGKELVAKIKSYAQLNNVEQLYLLTTTASGFFQKLGFERIDREQVPQAIKNTAEFKSICPVSAVCMKLNLGGEVKFIPQDILRLKEDVPGSKMWGLSLEKTMLTYFEVQPNCVFEAHQHESEQITLVLEGVLYFDVNGAVYPVKAGEVIAIPSNIKHSVFTKDDFVKAVDAWSPVMDKYKTR